jgi:AcrR family transcriptional regulator
MNDTTLTKQRIIEAMEDVLRRFGPAKTSVVDVARVLGVSHSSVYKHFASKAELLDAVMRAWLARVDQELGTINTENATATERLQRWLHRLTEIKRSLASKDPEMFATYAVLTLEAREVVEEHLGNFANQIERIIEDGVASGEFKVADPATTARAILLATNSFHNPAHAPEWARPTVETDFEDVCSLILNGINRTS